MKKTHEKLPNLTPQLTYYCSISILGPNTKLSLIPNFHYNDRNIYKGSDHDKKYIYRFSKHDTACRMC